MTTTARKTRVRLPNPIEGRRPYSPAELATYTKARELAREGVAAATRARELLLSARRLLAPFEADLNDAIVDHSGGYYGRPQTAAEALLYHITEVEVVGKVTAREMKAITKALEATDADRIREWRTYAREAAARAAEWAAEREAKPTEPTAHTYDAIPRAQALRFAEGLGAAAAAALRRALVEVGTAEDQVDDIGARFGAALAEQLAPN